MKDFKSYIKENAKRNDNVGKLSTRLLNDNKFNSVETEQEFINYVNSVSADRPELSEAVIKVKKELGLM